MTGITKREANTPIGLRKYHQLNSENLIISSNSQSHVPLLDNLKSLIGKQQAVFSLFSQSYWQCIVKS